MYGEWLATCLTGRKDSTGRTHAVLDSITPLAQNVVLQIQQLESSEEVLDELANLDRAVIVAECDRVDGQTRLEKSAKFFTTDKGLMPVPIPQPWRSVPGDIPRLLGGKHLALSG